jgi:hypothetical protein
VVNAGELGYRIKLLAIAKAAGRPRWKRVCTRP